MKDINQPRTASFIKIRDASKKTIPTWSASDLPEADPAMLGLTGSPTQVIQIFTPPMRTDGAELIKGGTVKESAALLADKIIAEKII